MQEKRQPTARNRGRGRRKKDISLERWVQRQMREIEFRESGTTMYRRLTITLEEVHQSRRVAEACVCGPCQEQVVLLRELRDLISKVLEMGMLTERERRVIKLHFGLGRAAPLTVREVGSVMGISSSRVHQLKLRALKKIRGSSRIKELATFLQ